MKINSLSLLLLVCLIIASCGGANGQMVNKTIIEWSRQLRTCDSQMDNEIPFTGTTKIVYSHNDDQVLTAGSSDTDPLYHGPNTRGSVSVNFYDYAGESNATDPNQAVVSIMTTPITVPNVGTYYHCQGFKYDWGSTKKHVIRARPSIYIGNSMLVHHILLMVCTVPLNETDLQYAGACYSDNGLGSPMPDNLAACDQVALLAGWAVGGGDVIFPDVAGYPVMGVQYYLMQIHYNNPGLVSGKIDSAGFNLTWTPQLRQYDAACLEFAREIPSILIPPGNSSFDVQGIVTNGILGAAAAGGNFPDTVNVFSSFLHAHLLGRGIRVSQFRNGEFLTDLDWNPFYDFNFQQTVVFQTPHILLPYNDSLLLTCTYDSSGRTTNTRGGTSTQQEMCQVYLYYYPAIGDPLTHVGSFPTDPTVVTDNPGTALVTNGIYPTHFTYGLLQTRDYANALFNQPTLTLPTNATVSPPCSTTYHRNYVSGLNATTYLPISQFNPSSYSHSQVLDTTGAYKLYWNVSMYNDGSQNGIIRFAVEVETSGWVGFGISPDGSMLGSDVIMGWVDPVAQAVAVVDRKVTTDHVQPVIDDTNGGTQDIFNIRGYYGQKAKTVVDNSKSIFYADAPVLPTIPQPTPSPSPIQVPQPHSPNSGIIATTSLFITFLALFLVVFS